VSLTDSTVVWLLWAVAVGAFVWTIVSWPKVAGGGWTAVLRRIGHQLAVVVLAVAALGATLNSQYGWYANWADLGAGLVGTAQVDQIQAAGAAPSDAAAGHWSGGDQSGGATAASPMRDRNLGLVGTPGPNGQYHTYTIRGPVSRVSGQVTVWFPAAYTSPGASRQGFPVIEAFHGIPGSPAQFSNSLDLGSVLAGQVANGNIGNAILVMPNFDPRGIDTECVNGGARAPRMEDWLSKDIPAWVDTHLRVEVDRGAWATMGFSAGGWCAGMLAMRHPNVFGAAISLGGYFQPTFEKNYRPFTSTSAQGREYDMVALARRDPPRIALWIQTSKTDPMSYGTTKELLRIARPPLSVTADVLTNAGHRMSVWVDLFPQTLHWLGQKIPGFAPAR